MLFRNYQALISMEIRIQGHVEMLLSRLAVILPGSAKKAFKQRISNSKQEFK